jgi:hypothetical protein
VIVDTPVYLTDAFRSQGFPPSQRFDPTVASRLCFAPHPSIGFWPPELFPNGQRFSLSASPALLSLSQLFVHFTQMHWRTNTDTIDAFPIDSDFRALIRPIVRHPASRG